MYHYYKRFVVAKQAIYVPFQQGALAYLMNPEWEGACGILSYKFMVEKFRQGEKTGSIMSTITPETVDPRYPNPMTFEENSGLARIKYFQKISASFAGHLYGDILPTPQPDLVKEHDNPAITREQKAKHLIDTIVRKKHSCGIVSSIFDIFSEEGIASSRNRHATAFVKMDKEVSFFDPNHGEINFSNAENFGEWIKSEIVDGRLHYMISDNKLSTVGLGGLGKEREEYPENADESVRKFVDIRNRRREESANYKFKFDGYEISLFSADALTSPPKPRPYKIVNYPDGTMKLTFVTEGQKKKADDTSQHNR